MKNQPFLCQLRLANPLLCNLITLNDLENKGHDCTKLTIAING